MKCLKSCVLFRALKTWVGLIIAIRDPQDDHDEDCVSIGLEMQDGPFSELTELNIVIKIPGIHALGVFTRATLILKLEALKPEA